jgi:hypothetical protein
MFGGFPFQEMPGSFESIDWSPIQPILDFMRTLICGGGGGDNAANEATATKEWTFLQDFFCDMLQYPERKPRVCLVLYSKEQQIGKGAIARWLGQALYGNYFQQIDDENHVLGDFTSVLADHIIINIDESSKHGQSYTLCGKLKNKISEPQSSITRKGFDQYYITSAHRYVYCINYKEALDIELFDQRFLVLECDPRHRGQKEAFDNIERIINENKALFWNYFRKRPINKHWNRKIPMTDAKRSIIQTKYPSIVQFVVRSPKFWQGQTALTALTALQGHASQQQPPDIVWHWDTLYQHYREWARDQQIECGIYKKPENLLEPLQTIGIKPGADQGRVRVAGSGKPSKGRDKGFKIAHVELVQNIQSFLTKMGESSDEPWMPPTAEGDDQNDDDYDSFE